MIGISSIIIDNGSILRTFRVYPSNLYSNSSSADLLAKVVKLNIGALFQV